MNFFSVPFTDKKTSKFFMSLFQENVDYRRNNNRQDFMNVLIQLMEKGYDECNNEIDVIGDSCKYFNHVICYKHLHI